MAAAPSTKEPRDRVVWFVYSLLVEQLPLGPLSSAAFRIDESPAEAEGLSETGLAIAEQLVSQILGEAVLEGEDRARPEAPARFYSATELQDMRIEAASRAVEICMLATRAICDRTPAGTENVRAVLVGRLSQWYQSAASIAIAKAISDEPISGHETPANADDPED